MKIKSFIEKTFNKKSLIHMTICCLWRDDVNHHFVKNICWGLAIAILLQFSHYTGFGQSMINRAHDVLVVKDFRNEVLDRDDENSISNDIRMIVFDQKIYENNRYPGGKYWTPRELLGNTLIKSIDMGATVIVMDFKLEKPVPLTCSNGKCVDENFLYLDLLQKAADVAKEKKCVIIMPKISPDDSAKEYTKAYQQLIEKNNDVIICGNPLVYQNSQDAIVRHFNFFQTDETLDPVFSVPVLAVVYHWFGKKKGDEFIQKAKTEIKERKTISPINSPKNNAKQIQFYHQDLQKECMAARFKFRILPKNVIHDQFGGGRILTDIIIPPTIILHPNFDPKHIENKIVVIGADYPDFGDIHQTPVGKIAGVYLIANTMNVLLMSNQVKEMHFVIEYFILLLWIVIASWLYTHLNQILSLIILIVLVVFISTPVSVIVFSKWGIFMDFWLPLTIMGIREQIESTIDSLQSIYFTKKEIKK